MTPVPNSSESNSSNQFEANPIPDNQSDRLNGQIAVPPSSQPYGEVTRQENSSTIISQPPTPSNPAPPSAAFIVLVAIGVMFVGLLTNSLWISIGGTIVATLISLRILARTLQIVITELVTEQQLLIALLGLIVAAICVLRFTPIGERLGSWYNGLNWDAVGATGEVVGAVGQILIAVLAVYIAWRQYVISKDLTIQQNLITQQQTIDSYFQGISELVLDAEGLLEDWPQERAIAEGRTAAILSSIDAPGKAKVIRFLSRSRLLTPLKRDRLLGRAILDGSGGYQEDRDFGVRVIDLGVMLAESNLAGTDLRWTDLSDANLIRANLNGCSLVKANLARTVLVDANLSGADIMGATLFYGSADTATPRSRADIPDYTTGAHTGAVVENADLTSVQRISNEQRYYCCAWGGSKTRATIPGGCEGIPNRLGR
ncbi:pentapeptide repeat-containing protein [Oscillatoria sp. FACHB-1407]|uniref:pentapeptide repeat-containing protein n=1 Tax=Oscillatoria sp. FACHB-1407 TaxID=2692847 RepID=UPI0016889525|nr:pentapeptide repeat-containing protein [Oscillatoria sp. FACHB-1407]MBD2461836.1 pentapeptide repeat-containing protein [Oscillatoria sp. FACHB-1407]